MVRVSVDELSPRLVRAVVGESCMELLPASLSRERVCVMSQWSTMARELSGADRRVCIWSLVQEPVLSPLYARGGNGVPERERERERGREREREREM